MTRSHVDEGRALDVRGRGTDAEGRGRVSPIESRMLARANVRRMSRRASARAGSAAPSEPLSTSTRYNVPRRKGILHPLFPREFDPGTAKIRKMTTRFHRGFAFGDRSATEDSRFHRARAHSGVAVTRIPVGGPPRPDGTPRTPLGAERHVFGRARAALDSERGAPRPVGWRSHRGLVSRSRRRSRRSRLWRSSHLPALRASGYRLRPPRPPEQPRPPVHLRRRPRTARARGGSPDGVLLTVPWQPVSLGATSVASSSDDRSGPVHRRRRRRPRTPLRHGIHGASPG